ncbi:hypothetical protein M413DRAFT_439927 [Hebeloma cylindrosporum]|uniref:Uncharacterized protein n=1 Tax=Hebeloma cylindrosporum TaxID=76867 RepID=A0A0C2Z4T2_HEBCY|nr:hypothetical protein M413DRAFT_439927 [Hebeloma cylindrosporum h7]
MFSSNHLSIPLGIVIGLISSFIQSLGLTIQRKSHVLNQSLPDHHQRVEHRRPLWLLGFVIFISSNVLGSFVQIASLPVVILAPLGAVSLLWNAFFARLLLGDVFSPWMILGTILIAGGAILIAFFGIVPEQTRSLEDLLALFRRPTFIVYFSLLGFVTFVCLAITHITEFSLSRRIAKAIPADCDSSSRNISPTSINMNLPMHAANLTANLLDEINDSSLATEHTPLLYPKPGTISPPSIGKQPIDPDLKSFDRTRLLLAISYASFSGIISGMCLLFAKSGVELLLLTLGGKNQFWRWEAWVLVLGLIVFALLQLWYLHKALVLADPTLVCPSAFCFYNLSSIVNGLVYFDQFSLIPPAFLGLVTLGIFILLCGVWVVSIQSGGGGVDVGTWNEESVKLSGEEGALYSEPEDTQTGKAVVMTRQQALSPPKVQIGPVRMERETRSESSLPNIPASSEINNGLGHGIEQRADSPNQSIISTTRRAETQLYGSRRAPSHRPQRPPADFTGSPSTSQLAHVRTVSHPHPGRPRHASLSPTLGGVPTLSTGFQIGLSPLSPGFTLTPRERRRRPTGFGIGGSFADVPHDVGGVRERRRTVSEGEVPSRLRNERGEVTGDADAEQGDDIAHDSSAYSTHSVDDSGHAGRGWTWFRSVFAWKD